MIHLDHIPTAPPAKWTKARADHELGQLHMELFELQNKFYADGRHALLIIIQGMDTSGKDGTIRHALMCMNPLGVHARSFQKPSLEEAKHDFLWRVYPHVPAKGMIQVFNRSYYEDVIVPTVSESLGKAERKRRYELINILEQHWERSGIHLLKFYLHISKEEQRANIKARKKDPAKRWKYDASDDKAAKQWDRYQQAFEGVISNCASVRWNIIPSGKPWYRNLKVAEIVRDHLLSLHLNYPV
jgi:PPK2 family polyphosphate:nucleotide phosphotransferase